MSDHGRRDWASELSDKFVPPDTRDSDDVEVPPEVEEWEAETKGVERVLSVAIATSQPRTAEWVAEQAVVSEQTAREHLNMFVDVGMIASFTSSGVTRYHADEAFLHYREVRRCVEQFSKDELTEEVEDIQMRIDELEETYDVKQPDALRAKAAEESVDFETVRDYKKTAAHWETLRDRLQVVEDALRRFEKFDRTIRSRV